MTPDTAITLHAWMTAHGLDVPMYGLVHPAIFKVPYLNVHTMKIGGIRAHPRQAMEAFDAGAVVLVYPGGGDEVYRSYARRNEIDLMGRTGFIKLAMKYRAPIIPLVAAGGHETLIVLHDGEGLARRLRLDRRGLPRLPISLTLPWGMTRRVHLQHPVPGADRHPGGAADRPGRHRPRRHARPARRPRLLRAHRGADAGDAGRDGRRPGMTSAATPPGGPTMRDEGARGARGRRPRRLLRHARPLPRGGPRGSCAT